MDLLVSAAIPALGSRITEPRFGIHLSTTEAFLTFIGIYTCLKIYRLWMYPTWFSPLRKLPGPKNNDFLLGQSINLYKSIPPHQYIAWMRLWPDEPLIRFLELGNREVIVVNSVKATKEVLQTHCYSFVKPGFLHRVLGEITGTGLLFAEGEHHKTQRRLLAGPFSYGTIKNLLPYFVSKAHELRDAVSTAAGRNPGAPIEISTLLTQTTLDAIGLAALGLKFNNLDSPTEFAKAFEEVFRMERSKMSTLMSTLNIYMPIRKMLPIKVNREYLSANAKIRQHLRDRIRSRKLELEDEKTAAEATDLLAVLLKERVSGKNPWTEDEIVNHLLNFLAAGHETTAGALTLTLFLLADHLEVQSRLREEINKAIPTPDDLTYSSVMSINYLSNVMKEVLRLYPPAILSHREAAKDVVVGGTLLPKGTLVHVVPAMIHYNTHIFGPDADKFAPDRWDGLPKEASDPFASGSFLNGPRICIGKTFALLEYKIYLVELLKAFEFVPSKEHRMQFQRGGPSLRPQGGLWLIPKPCKEA